MIEPQSVRFDEGFNVYRVSDISDCVRRGESWEIQYPDRNYYVVSPSTFHGNFDKSQWDHVPNGALVVARRKKPEMTTEQKLDKAIKGLQFYAARVDAWNTIAAQILKDIA